MVITQLHRNAGLDDAAYRAFLARSQATHPLGRPGTADEVAALAAFLCSDEAARSPATGSRSTAVGR